MLRRGWIDERRGNGSVACTLRAHKDNDMPPPVKTYPCVTSMPVSPRSPEAYIRRAQRVLLMVHELHKRGYQRLRIAPGMSPSGMHWRCGVTPRMNILKTHGALLHQWSDELLAGYGSGQEAHYFGWRDAVTDSARDLATKFEERFPRIVQLAKGRDWEYCGWYVEMLGYAEQGHIPIAYQEFGTDQWIMTTGGPEVTIPLPPGGDAVDDEVSNSD
jgi:hypothetical protein